jgi:large repetitive protein
MTARSSLKIKITQSQLEGNMENNRFTKNIRALFVMLLLCLVTSTAFAVTGPSVNVMPDGDAIESSYAWTGNPLSIWGNVKWGTSTNGTYAWDINNDGVADYTGSVTSGNANNINIAHTYAAAGHYEAKLTVTDGNGLSHSAVVRIYVKPAADKDARVNLAIEKGLKWLYLRQGVAGNISGGTGYAADGAETGAAILAFENRGHKPFTKPSAGIPDRATWEQGRIYAATVHKALDYMISTLTTVNASGQPYDSNGNGVMVRDNYANWNLYKLGLYMTALVGAGDVASGAPDVVATTGPVGIIGKTYKTLVQDMVDFADYAQYNDPNRGGWRYNPGDWPDNSACQWPVLGMEAGRTWGIPVRNKIISYLTGWVGYSQYSDGRFGYTDATAQGTGGYTALTGAGISQLDFLGVPYTDPRVVKAGNFLKGDKGIGNLYYMYSVTKGARNAKDSGGVYAPIQFLGSAPTWDWYNEYSNWLIANQASTGDWNVGWYTGSVMNTAFGVEILTKNVFTLRPISKLSAPASTIALTPVTFDLSGSHHQDAAKTLTHWWLDVKGDGTTILDGGFPITTPVTYSYPDKGLNYSVNAKLTVGDNSTPQETSDDVASISITSGNVPPVANAGGPYSGVVGELITFNGSASTDANACLTGSGPGCLSDSIVKYEWDLDGNGSYETNSGASPTVQKTWTTPYSGVIGLKVTDRFGLSSVAQVNAQVFVVNLWPENYVKVSEKRINTFVYEYTYKFDMRNRGNGAATNVLTTLVTKPAQVTIVDGNVNFGDIAGGTVKTSPDTFSFRIDRRYPVADFQLRWKLEYDYQGTDGSSYHQIFADFPLQ